MIKKFFWITLTAIIVVIAVVVLFAIADALYLRTGPVERTVEKAKP